jgi:hypothetical protein
MEERSPFMRAAMEVILSHVGDTNTPVNWDRLARLDHEELGDINTGGNRGMGSAPQKDKRPQGTPTKPNVNGTLCEVEVARQVTTLK